MYVDSKMKNILALGEDPTQGLYNVTTAVEDKYPINFTESGERFVLSLHYKGSNSFLFINATKIYKFKGKDSEIKPYPLWLDNISKDFTFNMMKKTELKGSVKVFSVDFNVNDTSNILDVDK